LSEFSQDVDARDKPGHDELCGKATQGGSALAYSTDRQTEMAEYATAIPPYGLSFFSSWPGFVPAIHVLLV
jgi:hypothetical protein